MDIMKVLGNLGFDWRMALANLFNFLIVFWLLKKYAFGPIKKVIQAREEKIKAGLDDADKAKSEVLMAKENYEQKINEAKVEANRIIASATDQGRELVSKASEDASQKTAKIIAEAKELISKEKEKMLSEVKKETIEIALLITEKIIKEKLDAKKDDKLIKELLKK